MKRVLTILLALMFTMIVAVPVMAQNDIASQAIEIAANSDEFSAFLSDFEWNAEAYEEGEGMWGVEFFMGDEEEWEWLGWALVDVESSIIIEAFMPRFMSDEELETYTPRVEEIALEDPEVVAILGDPADWEMDTYWDPYEHRFYVSFYSGLDAYVAVIWLTESEDDDVEVLEFQEFFDENAFEAAEAERERRDVATWIAYEADGVWEALENTDDWQAFVQHMGGSQYSVEFVSGQTRLFYALVDIETETILEQQ